jgi:hypothetical protein
MQKNQLLMFLPIGKFEKSVKIKIRNFLRNVFGKDATKFEQRMIQTDV